MLIALLVAQLVTAVPGNVSKVPRGEADAILCKALAGIATIQAGLTYEILFFVDGTLRYQTLEVFLMQVFGPVFSWGQSVSDQEPVCPTGPNAGQRPHIMPLRVVMPGLYVIHAVVRGSPGTQGVVIDQIRVTVQ
jgi:hypothetical protein